MLALEALQSLRFRIRGDNWVTREEGDTAGDLLINALGSGADNALDEVGEDRGLANFGLELGEDRG